MLVNIRHKVAERILRIYRDFLSRFICNVRLACFGFAAANDGQKNDG